MVRLWAAPSTWTPTEIWPPREATSEDSDGEAEPRLSDGEAEPRLATMSENEAAAKSCKIISHASAKHVTYTIKVEGVHEPYWILKKTKVERRFHRFQGLHRVIASQAKANKIAAPPRMPDGGGAMMWFQRHNPKTIAKREERFNQILEYMITTPVINEHEAVMEFLGLEFKGYTA